MKFYAHPRCSTCEKARKLLAKLGVEYQEIDLTAAAPSKRELKIMLAHADGRYSKLFNTSGMKYRELKLTEKLPQMPDEAKLELLASDGMLVKRPFLLTDEFGLLGFQEAGWNAALSKFGQKR